VDRADQPEGTAGALADVAVEQRAEPPRERAVDGVEHGLAHRLGKIPPRGAADKPLGLAAVFAHPRDHRDDLHGLRALPERLERQKRDAEGLESQRPTPHGENIKPRLWGDK